MSIFNVLSEVVRSFKRRFWINILLMIQFTICFFLLITMMTYYFTIGESNEYGTICSVNERDWYMLRMETSDSLIEFSELAASPDGLERISDLYGTLQNSDNFDLISAREWQNIYLKTEFMDSHFGSGNYEQLLDDADGTLDHRLCYVELKEGEETHSVVSIKSVQMNQGAFAAFDLQVVEGTGFTKENTYLDSAENPIPVVLGSDYLGSVSVGEQFWLALPTLGTEDWLFQAIVVGILAPDSIMPVYGGSEAGAGKDTVNLDRCILVANGVELGNLPKGTEEKAKFASAIYADALNQSYISPRENINYQSVVKEVSDISREYEVNLFFTSVSFGMELLLQETETAMAVLLILTGAMAVFTVFVLISTCITRVRDNAEVYAIRMLNGAGLKQIIAPCLWEFAVLLVPPLIVNYFLLSKNMQLTRNYSPMVAVAVMALGIFFLAAYMITWKMGGIDIEEHMRRRE